jgi:transcriptional regulator
MHPNPIFHDEETTQNLGFARERGFGVLTLNGEDAPLISHVPLLVAEDGESLELHLVRSNPIARALKTARPACVAVSGPDGYISPDWYGIDDQVPTWNYVAVHLSGVLELRPADELQDLLERQSAFYEARLLPKPPWTPNKMSPDALEKMMRMIVPARMRITHVDGTWKLNQNKPPEVIAKAADLLEATGYGVQTDVLAGMMRDRRR